MNFWKVGDGNSTVEKKRERERKKKCVCVCVNKYEYRRRQWLFIYIVGHTCLYMCMDRRHNHTRSRVRTPR